MGIRNSGASRFGSIPPIAAPAIVLAALLVAGEARANPIVTRCARLTAKQSAELEARAELTLSTLERNDGAIIIDCDPWVSVLIWFDGSRRKIDEGNGLVEGALDAIEEQAARGERSRRSTAPVYFDESPRPETRPSLPKAAEATEGGFGVATTVEPWGGTARAGMGARLDFGLVVSRGFAFVGSEGVRFSVGNRNDMVFDLQGGFAFGAPYGGGGLGVVLLGGVERFAGSEGNDTLWIWTASLDVGARGAIANGPFALWGGVDLLFRDSEIQTGGPDAFGIPNATLVFSLGGFWSAWPFSERTPNLARR